MTNWRCDFCDEPIVGKAEWDQYESRVFHPDCVQKAAAAEQAVLDSEASADRDDEGIEDDAPMLARERMLDAWAERTYGGD